MISNDFFLFLQYFSFRIFQENFKKSFDANSESKSQRQNDWKSYSYNDRSSTYNSPEKSNNDIWAKRSSNQTSPWKGSTSSESSWSSNNMSGISRWPSSASVNSMCSTKSTKTYWSDTPMQNSSFPSAPTSSRSNSFDEQNKRLFYASHSVFLNNLRSGSSEDSFTSEFDKFYTNKK